MAKKQIILGIESSCDETGAAVLSKAGDQIQILSNVIASSASLQAKYGGIIPEQAAREQIKSIIPVIEEALLEAKVKPDELDAIAVTYGPGLIGSLLVGVETAKTLALVWNKPLIPVNHLLGHFYANWISQPSILNTPYSMPVFPCVGLLVSGGHSDLVLFKDHQTYEYLGGTRDDAAGECFDKCARLLGLPYPGGPQISKLALSGNPKAYKLPRPMSDSKDLDFSFSGLKTAVHSLLSERGVMGLGDPHRLPATIVRTSDGGKSRQDPEQILADFCASIEAAIVDSLIKKTVTAVRETNVEHLIVAGGVAANQKLVQELRTRADKLKVRLYVPPVNLCTDNAAMIAARAFFEKPVINPLIIEANPNLSLEDQA